MGTGEESAIKVTDEQLDLVRSLVPRLEGAKSRFTGLRKGGGPWARSN